MNFSKRRISIIVGLLLALFLYIFFFTPNSQQKSLGSSYNYSPDGYAGWYQYMVDQGATVKRWQKPLTDLPNSPSQRPVTLLVINNFTVNNFSDWLNYDGEQAMTQWLSKGNRLVILGYPTLTTKAPFTTLHQQDTGSIKIETTRRMNSNSGYDYKEPISLSSPIITPLKDEFGNIVWGDSNHFFSSTPYLGANAYQAPLMNYKFLAGIVQPSANYEVWIDEYIHGYKDKETLIKEKAQATTQDFLNYLRNTPFFPLFLQLTLLLFVAIFGLNIRLGKPKLVPSIKVNNSQAYITALADVLEKGENRDMIIETIMKEEQRKLQKALGLGTILVDKEVVYGAWQEQTQLSEREIKQVLEINKDPRSLNDADIIEWLRKWRSIHATVAK